MVMIMQYLCVISLLVASATAFSNLDHIILNLDLNETHLRGVDTKTIEHPLDHFDPSEKRTITIMYYENLEFWKAGGPVYIFIDAEGPLSKIWVSNYHGFLMAQMSKDTKGAMFAAEHRYYGNSLPDISEDNAIEYFKFLNSRQALEDMASFIKMLKSDSRFKSSKVVVVGGSYSGNLAVWMRELHPELVDAAVASSAPVLAKKDFKEYLDAVRNTFDKYGTEGCLQKMEKNFKESEELLKTEEGREELKKKLNICPESDLTVLENQQLLFYLWRYMEAMKISQTDLPEDVKEYCDKLESGHVNPFPSMFSRASFSCYPLDFKAIDFTKGENPPWAHQACTEFGYLTTTSSEKQPFVHWVPVEFLLKWCNGFITRDIEKTMDEGIAKTNQMYGGLTPNVTKVVFTHGDMDPWHTIGVQKDLGPDAPAFIVEGTSHCRILCAYDNEPEKMTENRKQVKELIEKWIAE